MSLNSFSTVFVDSADDLARLCAELSGRPWLAIDTEFIRERTYYPQLCLLQVSDGNTTACIDPLALPDLGPLIPILDDPRILKVFHAATQDLEIFYHLTGRVPAPVFDTQLAAALTGHGDQIGYANLVKAILGVELDKAHTRADWSRRPLSAAELAYAAADVYYLCGVFEKLSAELAQRGRGGWLAEEFASLSDPARFENVPEDAWERVSGAQRLRTNQLKVLRALAAWREREAREHDRPRKWILTDDLRVELARRQPRELSELGRIRGLQDGVIQRSGAALLQAISAGMQGPAPRAQADGLRVPPEQQALVELLQAYVHVLSAEQQISTGTLVGRRDLEKLVMGERDLPVLRGWRKQAAGQRLIDLIEGRLSLAVENGRVVGRAPDT